MRPTEATRRASPWLAALALLAGLAASSAVPAREHAGVADAHPFVELVPPQSPGPGATQAARRHADDRVARALDALLAAERALRRGQQPLPGERRHLVDGYSRLTQAYFDRLQALQTAVDKARSRLQSAYAARDALDS